MFLPYTFFSHPFFKPLVLVLFVGILVSCNIASNQENEPQKKIKQSSFFLDSLRDLEVKPANRPLLEEKMEEARMSYLEDSTDLNNIIWYGRRLAYLHHFDEAIRVFSGGLNFHPRSPELYRHRGHRLISIRRFEEAIFDLRQAARLAKNRPVEIEPDGLPNKLDIPLSNLHFNIYYHLGLAYYLLPDYANAVKSFTSCMKYADNDDLRVATTYWLVLTYLRLREESEVQKYLLRINPYMEIIENQTYLEQLLVIKNQKPFDFLQDSVSQNSVNPINLYGISVWKESLGDTSLAAEIRKRILSTGHWTYFGYIAAEADSLSRLTD